MRKVGSAWVTGFEITELAAKSLRLDCFRRGCSKLATGTNLVIPLAAALLSSIATPSKATISIFDVRPVALG